MKVHKFFLIIALTTAALAIAQTATPGSVSGSGSGNSAAAPMQSPASSPPGSLVPESAPVITIDGVCDVSLTGNAKSAGQNGTSATAGKSPASASDCKTQVTRGEFEKLMKTVAPGAPPQARRQIASRYVQLLTAANQGVKLGVDKDPDFSEQLAIMRLQLLMQDADRKLQAQAANITDAELKSYYDQNPSAYEELTLTRLFVPRNPGAPDNASGSPDAKPIADKAREQLAAGGDPEQIQKSIYEQLKNSTQPPTTKLGARRRGTLPKDQEQKLFALKQGEVSEVFSDPTSYVIYRVDSRQQLPFEQVKDQVKQTLTRQRMADVREQMTNASKADFNDAYFGPEAAGAQLGPPGGPGAPSPHAPGGPHGAVSAPGQAPSSQPAAPPNPK